MAGPIDGLCDKTPINQERTMTTKKFYGNAYSPENADFTEHYLNASSGLDDSAGVVEVIQQHISNCEVTDPQPTDEYRAEQLKEMGYVGLWK